MADKITILLSHEEAEQLSSELADWLCWRAGFLAGRDPDITDFVPECHYMRMLNNEVKSKLHVTKRERKNDPTK